MSTGEGKAKVLDEKETTVYKRALDQEYKLKLKASRGIFSEINKKYPTMPFTVRSLDSKQSRLGLVECLNHGLLHPYPVLHEKVRPHAASRMSSHSAAQREFLLHQLRREQGRPVYCRIFKCKHMVCHMGIRYADIMTWKCVQCILPL